MKTICPYCSRPVFRSIAKACFVSGYSPSQSFEPVLEAEWCATPNCYQRVQLRSHRDRCEGDFIDEVMRARDLIQPIADGTIKRGKRESQYDSDPGMRKATITDAKRLCASAILRLNKAYQAYSQQIF